ncbi:MAG: cation diffusion facilitator family transporter [Candidatus Heimdallarchaeota archaeon]|nr:cation diffusion facilitator family transporter [Candidatus Heimdallarchaeota archaeon]MCK5049276.1 cation diffusion facilitator family transporter [Candidatus Heimdallarchaeota archaeon]
MNQLQSAEMHKAALLSIYTAIFLTTIKTVAAILTGSLGILSEVLHSALDLVAAMITFFAVKKSNEPPDQTHHFGHKKVEAFSALAEALLLIITCIWILSAATDRLIQGSHEISLGQWGIIVMLISIMLDWQRSNNLQKIGDKYGSQALKADALHFRSDIYSSAVVIVGLIGAELNIGMADPLAAIIVALIVLKATYKLSMEAVDDLLDKAPEEGYDKVKDIISSIEGIREVERIRMRGSQESSSIYIDAIVSMNPSITLFQAHLITEEAEKKVKEVYPKADVMIHMQPDEEVQDAIIAQVRIISQEYDNIIAVHSFQLADIGNEMVLSLHIEFKPEISLRKAHEIATSVEVRILEKLPVTQVLTHLEESRIHVIRKDVTEKYPELISRIKDEIMKIGHHIPEKMVLLEGEDGKLDLHTTCHFKGELTIEETHKVTSITERHLHQAFMEIERILIHIEPHKK